MFWHWINWQYGIYNPINYFCPYDNDYTYIITTQAFFKAGWGYKELMSN